MNILKLVFSFFIGKSSKENITNSNLPPYFSLIHLNKSTPLKNIIFTVIDTETTGLNSKKDNIISIGAIKIKESRITLSESFSTNVYLSKLKKIQKESIKIHLITPNELENAPTSKEILPSLLEFIGNSVVVGHHVNFDKAFLQRECKRIYGLGMHNVFIDTSKIAYKVSQSSNKGYYFPGGFPDAQFSLDYLCSKYGLPITDRHNSFSDALITAQLFLILLKKAELEHNVKTLRDLILLSSK